MKNKSKGNQIISANSPNVGKKKNKRKSAGVNESPEVNLGLKLEKLIEKGVKVKKMKTDKSENNMSRKLSITPKKVSSDNVLLTGKTNVTPKIGGAVVKKASPPKLAESSGKPVSVNGKSKKGKKRSLNTTTEIPGSPDNKKQKIYTRLDLRKVTKAAQACLDHAKAKQKNNKLLDGPDPLFIQIVVVKKAITASHSCRFKLQHKLINEDGSVCMFLRDEKGKEPDILVEEFNDLLKKHGVENINKVLTYSQLRSDYGPHELRRKLCNSHDAFIADGRLSKTLLRHLGRHFIDSRKIPLYIKFRPDKLGDDIDQALHKTVMKITSNQDMFSCIVGYTNFPAQHIAENIVSLAEGLNPSIFPGGWVNVRSISMKTVKGPKFPLYFSNVNPNSVEEPVMQPTRPKSAVPVFGELSSKDGAMVRVDPDGTVTIIKKDKSKPRMIKDDSDDDDDDDENDSDEEDDETKTADEEEEEEESDFELSDDEDEPSLNTNNRKSPSVLQKKKQSKNSVMDVDEEEDDDDDDDDEDEDDDDDEDEEDEESDEDDGTIGNKAEMEYLKGMKKMLNRNKDEEDDDDEEDEDEDSDEGEDDSDEDEVPVNQNQQKNTGKKNFGSNVNESSDDDEDDSDDEEETESEDENISSPPALNKMNMGSRRSTPPVHHSPKKRFNNNHLNKSGNKIPSNGTFDTSLGEKWTVKKNQPNQKASPLINQDGKGKKNNAKKHKINKHQRKANIKMKNAKKNKN